MPIVRDPGESADRDSDARHHPVLYLRSSYIAKVGNELEPYEHAETEHQKRVYSRYAVTRPLAMLLKQVTSARIPTAAFNRLGSERYVLKYFTYWGKS
jgi:hypothetical protein